MRLIIIRKKLVARLLIVIAVVLVGCIVLNNKLNKGKYIMGGVYLSSLCEENEIEVLNTDEDIEIEKYFRPSNLPILNRKNYDLEKLPDNLFETPENTIMNYYSILREASNPTDKTKTGCGTLGYAKNPYPIAYKFLSPNYQKKLSYNKYLKSFENILHINLIKLNEVKTDENHPSSLKYFIELETIEGSEKEMGYFGYYYGFVYLDKVNSEYKISDIQSYGENYLCTPYHGWIHDAKSFVEIQYGDWCSLIKGEVKVEKDGYIKNIYFTGTDGNEYRVEFFTLTNGDDIKIADFKKDKNNKWIEINIDPEKCLEKNKK